MILILKFYFSVQVFFRLHSGWDQTFYLHHTTASLRDDNSSSPNCQYNLRTTQVVKRLWRGKRRESQSRPVGQSYRCPEWALWRAGEYAEHGQMGATSGTRWAKKQLGSERLFKPPHGILWSSASKLLQTTLVVLWFSLASSLLTSGDKASLCPLSYMTLYLSCAKY